MKDYIVRATAADAQIRAFAAATKETVETARKAVQSGAWVLYEYENGKVKVTARQKELLPIREYVSLQKRFRGISEENIGLLQLQVRQNYQRLLRMEEQGAQEE